MPAPSRPGRPRPGRARSTPPAPSPRPFPWVPVAVGVAVLLALVAVVLAGGKGDDSAGDDLAGLEQVRPVQAAGAPLAPLGDGDDPAVGTPAPTLEGASFDGTPVTIGADERPKVLVFLAHWCPHCQRTVKVLSSWLADHGAPDDVDVYGIATSTSPDRPNYPPSAWLDREGWTLPTLADDGTAAQAYGLTSFPMIVAVGADGDVVLRSGGELPVSRWEEILDAARGGVAG